MDVTKLTNHINIFAAASPTGIPEASRKDLLLACEKLRDSLETPFESAFRWFFTPYHTIALRLAVDMQLFDATAEASKPGHAVGIEQMACKSGADPLLVTRIVRILVGMRLFTETSAGAYAMTPLAAVYVTGSPMAEAVLHMTTPLEVLSRLPAYFSTHGFTSPNDGFDGPFQYARQTKLHCFDWIATQPRLQHAFNVVMTTMQSQRGAPWHSFFPVEQKLSGTEPFAPLIVDVGAGVGHHLVEFKALYPGIHGRLIAQDLAVVVDSIGDLPAGIEAMPHDFFTPQPVRGARAYFLVNVLHDWPDKQALQILRGIRSAMGPHSMLLVNENVLPETGVSLLAATADLVMMANFSALERTLKQFTALLEAAGLDMVKAWAPEGGNVHGRMLLEAVLKK